jgi:hypothetical protein
MPSRATERETLRLDASDVSAAGTGEADSEDQAEARMRQALGLFGQRSSGHSEHTPTERRQGGGGHMQVGARRHRFVQDGEVPVSVVRGRRDQQAASLAPALPRPEGRDRVLDEQSADRAAREAAERKLADAQTVLRTLQTRLGHAELERDEAIEEARVLREQLASERAVADERQAVRSAPVEARRERMVAPVVETVAEDIEANDEPEPVKWWL